ncbi:MAG: thioether cross-link-forming SCIFF peptide maturase [Bacillota bacterium]
MAKIWHVFSVLDRRYLYDVYSGSLFELDVPAKRELEKYAGLSFAEAVDAGLKMASGEAGEFWEEAGGWAAQGFFSGREPEYVEPGENEPFKAFCLHASHDCDLRCAYCFAGKGSFGGERMNMPLEIAQKAVDMLLAHAGRRRHVEIDFFGGEPLLNWPAVREAILYGKKKARASGKILNFTLTTNALALTDEAMEFIIKEDIGMVLSLDGRPEVHNRWRKTREGTGSYHAVLPNIRKAVARKNGAGYYVRGTFTRYNTDFTEDVKHLLESGFHEISLEPVVAPQSEGYAVREEDLPEISAEYEKLARFYLEERAAGRGFNFFHFNLNLAHGPCLLRRLAGCGAGARYFAVTPRGELYPCHQFVGIEEFKLGDVYNGITRPDLRRRFQQADIYHKKGCADCWARFLCSGGCHANAFSANRDILEPDRTGCAMMRKRLECALAVQAVSAISNQ